MNISWQHVIDGDGIGITITGMLVVFAGLSLIATYIALLPRILNWAENRSKARAEARVASARSSENGTEASSSVAEGEEDPDLMGAVAMVLHMEMQNLMDSAQRITINRDESQSMWLLAGKMRTLRARR